jgi:hypothetical protein
VRTAADEERAPGAGRDEEQRVAANGRNSRTFPPYSEPPRGGLADPLVAMVELAATMSVSPSARQIGRAEDRVAAAMTTAAQNPRIIGPPGNRIPVRGRDLRMF